MHGQKSSAVEPISTALTTHDAISNPIAATVRPEPEPSDDGHHDVRRHGANRVRHGAERAQPVRRDDERRALGPRGRRRCRAALRLALLPRRRGGGVDRAGRVHRRGHRGGFDSREQVPQSQRTVCLHARTGRHARAPLPAVDAPPRQRQRGPVPARQPAAITKPVCRREHLL